MKAGIFADKRFPIGSIDDKIYGSFVEHLGRAVYGGVYEPGHGSANEEGFRTDVAELVRRLNVPLIRYPGGNFVSGYYWEDGVGPVAQRPRRLDFAWSTIEPNTVGIGEFQRWIGQVNSELLLTVNLGTRGMEDAGNLVEYCNFPAGSKYSELRRRHGYEKPFNVRYWCLGNEMDAPWQTGEKSADEYGRIAAQTAKVMKWIDPTIKLVACGSSNSEMPTFGTWEETVLEHCYDYVDYISLHNYYGNSSGNTPEYLACCRDMEESIKTVAAICDVVKRRKRSDKTVYLSFDEWNVWFHSMEQDKRAEKWQVAPPLLEDIYTLEDALVVGCLIITLLKHCDRVKIACLAQLVNVIAPIMTETGGRAWAQTIFYPFLHASSFARGTGLHTKVSCGEYEAGKYGATPYVESVVTYDEQAREIAVLAVNRSLEEDIELEVELGGFGEYIKLEHLVLSGDDLQAVNTADAPETVVPHVRAEGSTVLERHSWNLIRYKY